jgi:hypothetical protein
MLITRPTPASTRAIIAKGKHISQVTITKIAPRATFVLAFSSPKRERKKVITKLIPEMRAIVSNNIFL